MKRILLYSLALLFAVTSCITIEDEPFVTVAPDVEFVGHILKNKVVVTATIHANPAFINPGNIPTIFYYEGLIELYNASSGILLGSSEITGDGLTAVVEVEADDDDFEKILVIASGTVSAYADAGSDGETENDLFLHKSTFYEERSLAEVINIQDYPVVTMAPDVEYQLHIRGSDLYTAATISANPTYINTGTFPMLFEYNGVIQVYDQVTGALLKSSTIRGEGLTNAVTVINDTTGFNGFVVITSGGIVCSGDVESDGSNSNDIFISQAEFYEVLTVDLTEE